MKQKIIFLNGTSSSGKTSIAKELLKLNSYLYLSLDDAINNQPSEILKDKDRFQEFFPKVISEFHKTIKKMADQNKSLVIDHILEKPEWYEECKKTLKDKLVTWVSVICPLEELEMREASRKDRTKGLAKFQYNFVYKGYIHDLRIDTLSTTSQEAAIKIESYAKRKSFLRTVEQA